MSYSDAYAGGYGDPGVVDAFYVEIDWDKDSVYTDETARVRPQLGAVVAQYGRDQSTALAPTVSGTGSFTLDNSDRRYSPWNGPTTMAGTWSWSLTSGLAELSGSGGSPLYGYIKPARPVRIRRDFAGGSFVLFDGHTDDTPINPQTGEGAKTVSLSLVDWLADLRGQQIHTAIYAGIRTGEAIGVVLDACGWPADLRDLDLGATVCPWWWEDGTEAGTALEKLVRSEGPPAMLSVGAAGEIVFRDRHHRLLRSASLTSQQTWGDATVPLNRPFSWDAGWSQIVNHGSVDVEIRRPGPLEAVWTSDSIITLTAGEERLITASASDPFYGAIAPVAGTDYVAVSGTVETQLLRTSGGSAAIKLTAIGGTAVISGLQLRAQPVAVAYTTQVSASNAASIADYGTRSFPGDLPWCGPDDAQAVLDTAVALRADPLPIVTARMLVGNDHDRASLLARDLGDRVHIIEAETVTNHDFYVESIAHEISDPSGADHAVTFGLEAAPVPISPVFRFDTAGGGFNDGKFGAGIDEPANMFRFDTSGQGFNAGVFAH